MKKRILITALFSMSFLLTACSGGVPAENAGKKGGAVSAEAEEAGKEEELTENTSAIGNPWKDNVSAEEAAELLGAFFIVPDGAENVTYRIMESDKLGEMDFDLDGLSFCARMKPSESFEDISGLYYTWETEDDGDIYGAEGKLRRAKDGDMTVDNCLWYDQELSMMFSVSTSDKDLDGFDITAIAQAMYQPSEEEGFIPSTFVEANSGKDSFESYDELISLLNKGEGYAYIKLKGYEGELLAVTDNILEDEQGNKITDSASIYGDTGEKVVNFGNVFGNGKEYPVRCDGELIYCAGEGMYESDFVTGSGDGIMVKDYIAESTDENGEIAYFGFLRDTNSFDEEKELPEDKEEAQKLYEKYIKDYYEKEALIINVVE